MNGDNRVNDDAAARRRQLGRTLRQARMAARLTQSAAAERLGCGQAKINKIETKLVAVSMNDLDRLISIYGLPGDEADDLREQAKLDQVNGPPRTKDGSATAAFIDLSDLEPEAVEILCWHSERIPGPLQSERYMLAQHEPIQHSEQVVRLLRQRKARAKIFGIDNPPRYRAVLSESALHRMPGGRSKGIGVDQAAHLLRLINDHDCLELQILTFEATISFVDTDFQLLSFAKEHLKDFTYIEFPGGSIKLSTAAELTEIRTHWDQVSTAALTPDESRKFLSGLAEMDEL